MGKVLRRGLVLEIFSRQNASFWLSKIGRIERMQEDSSSSKHANSEIYIDIQVEM